MNLGEFARTRGAKDKKKRSRMKAILPLVGLGIGSLALMKLKKSPKQLNKVSETVDKAENYLKLEGFRDRELLKESLMDEMSFKHSIREQLKDEVASRDSFKKTRKKRRLLGFLQAQKTPGIKEDLYIARNSSKKFTPKQRKAAVKRVNDYFSNLKSIGAYRFLGDISNFKSN